MKRIIGMVAILALLSTACAPTPTPTPTPTTPSPSTSASSAPTESMGAAEPRVVCETPDEPQITLTCEAGVAVARAVVGADPAVAAIEYYLGWGPLCPPGAFCRARALAPTPRAGPENSQSTRKWSRNGSWLARTERNSKTSEGGASTEVETEIGRTTFTSART